MKLAAASVLAALALLFLAQVSISAGGGDPQIILTTNRMVILDDPGGWDGGNKTIDIDNVGNQWSGESTTVRWYVLLINSQGRAAQGVTATSQLIFPNGTVAATKTSTTGDSGIAEFEQDMDRWSRSNGGGSEGIYTITADAALDGTSVAGSYNFIYDEWGCGSSGRGCHRSQFWQPNANVKSQQVNKFADGSIQNSPYLHAYDNFHSNADGHGKKITFGTGECLTCHSGFDGVMRDHNGRVRAEPQFPAGIHFGKTACTNCHTTFGRGEMPIRQCYDCHPLRNDNLTEKTFSQTDTSGFSFQPLISPGARAHNENLSVPCILCHKGMHNVSKPLNVTGTSNTYTEYQQCTSCHTGRSRHNNSVNCTVCHSQDAHVIKVFAQDATYITGAASPSRGNCTSCHQDPSFLNTLLQQPGAGSYSGTAPQIPAELNHSNDPIAGQKWNSYWNPENKLSACNYCHGDTKHSASALGRPSQFKGSNTVSSTISAGSTWCQQCHYQGGSNYTDMVITLLNDGKQIPPENTGNSTYGNLTNSTDGRQKYFNHSGFESYTDAKCKGCHGSSIESDNIKDFLHNVSVGRMGGPNCLSCHDYGRTGSPKRINSSAMSLGMHAQLNSNALNTADVPAENRKCWGCHQSDGSQPPSGSMGDRYSNPYKCYDCHSETKPYAGVNAAPNVSEHFRGGSDIRAAINAADNSSSCTVCHNLTEMKVDYIEDDTYRTGFSLPSHYGRKRANDPQVRQGARTNCTYCHQNTSTPFAIAMANTGNSNISNHSTRYGSSPYCTECHKSGWIHNSTLTKPALQLPTSTLCLGCHGLNASSGGTNYTGMVTGVRERHNNSVNCTSCHLSTSRDIHPVKYLQPDAAYTTNNSSAVNCTSCHQNPMFFEAIAGILPPQIPGTLNHSNDPIAGQKWNSTGYWNPENKLTACYYCHGDTKHSASALGRPSQFKGSNTVNSTISAGSTWCQQCHYQGGSNYTDMVITLLNDGKPVPPENTGNSTYGNLTNSTDGRQKYFNHSGFDSYADAKCKGCHGISIESDNIKEFVHNVSVGRMGGPNCIGCHDYGRTGSPKRVNSSAMGMGMHELLNSNALNSADVPAENKKCWGCHQSDGSQPPSGSMGDRYSNPYKCYDCHSETKPYGGVNAAPNVSEHFRGGSDIKAAKNAADNSSSCTVCHNLTEMKVDYIEDDTYSTKFSLPSHYGRKRANDPQVRQGSRTNCTYCHQNTSTVFAIAMANAGNSNISNHSSRYTSSPYCTECHKSGWIHNSTLTKPALQLPTSTLCLGCHGLNASGGGTNYSGMVTGVREKHNNSVNCTSCHLATSRDIHPVKYLQPDASYARNISSAVNCTSCHQNPLFSESAGISPPQIPGILNHSNDPIAGRKWNSTGYWNPGNKLTACYYCHGDTKHSAGALGRPYLFKGNNSVKSAISAESTWCQQCHYQRASNYSDMVVTFLNDGRTVPPENTGNSTYGNLTNSTDGSQKYFNHSGFDSYSDAKCKGCHGRLVTENNITGFVHNVAVGIAGGPDCASCHDTGGIAPKTIDFSIFKQSVHRNLNSNAANSTILSDTVDKACWACHDSGGREPPSGSMGDRRSNPRKCYNDECHALSQSFQAPMLYSHFKDAEMNGNPSRALNFNISTKASCVACHSNSLNAETENLNASVSHYASRKNLPDSMNCIYCHLDEDNAKKWGNAVEINKNRTVLTEMNREMNKFTARKGELVDLGQGLRIRVMDVSASRDSATFELYRADKLIDSGLVKIGRYEYSENLTIKNASARTPVIVLNVTGMFLSGNESFIQFDGSRTKRVHRENKTTSCYKCHFKGEAEKRKYTVIDRWDEYVYYTEVLFNSSGRKEYDQEQALRIIANLTTEDKFVTMEKPKRKTLKEKENWDIAPGYSLTLEEVSENSDSAQFTYEAGGRTYTDIVKKGEAMDFKFSTDYLGYMSRDITIFRAKVSEIQSEPGMVVLEDILALSPDIKKVKENETIFGYNTSWQWENSTIITGKIPVNFHSPKLFDGRDGGPDCRTCHTIELGVHTPINKAASSSVSSDSKQCWACHGDGTEPKGHPATHRTPRKCKSCHVEQKAPFFNAPYVGDEKHGEQQDCTPCHVINKHTIRRFVVTPGIRELSLSKKEVYAGETVIMNVTAAAGHMMRLKAAEYYVDSLDKAYPLNAVDGAFDEQIEELRAEIDTTGLKPGEHLIHVRAMERNNDWGIHVTTTLIVKEQETGIMQMLRRTWSTIAGVFLSVFVIVALYTSKKRLNLKK